VGKWLWMLVAGLCVVMVLQGCRRYPTPPRPAPSGPQFVVVMVDSSPAWLASHKVSASLGGTVYGLPLVLQTRPSSQSTMGVSRGGDRDANTIGIDVNGAEFDLVVKADPAAPILGAPVIRQGGVTSLVVRFEWGPSGPGGLPSHPDPRPIIEQAQRDGKVIVLEHSEPKGPKDGEL